MQSMMKFEVREVVSANTMRRVRRWVRESGLERAEDFRPTAEFLRCYPDKDLPALARTCGWNRFLDHGWGDYPARYLRRIFAVFGPERLARCNVPAELSALFE